MVTTEPFLGPATIIPLPITFQTVERLVETARCEELKGRDVVCEGVHLALRNVDANRGFNENRLEARHPYPYPVHLTPLDADGRLILDDTVVVLGRHLSDHGLDFYHREPLGGRRFIASLPVGTNGWIAFVLELSWTRFSRHGWYDNGGKFLQKVASPLPARAN